MIWADRVAVVWAVIWVLVIGTSFDGVHHAQAWQAWFLGVLAVWLPLRGLDWIGTGGVRRS